MAHIAKYKASAVGKLCAHYNRWQGIDNPNVSRENIDKSRTHLNYTLGVYEKDGKRFIGKVRGSASWATVKGRIDAVNARAKAEGAAIYWADETAVKEDAHWIRGFAPAGRTPVLEMPARWGKLSMISATWGRTRLV